MRGLTRAAAAVAAGLTVAAVPAVPTVATVPSVTGLSGVVEVVTLHREVPDGVLEGQVALSGGCPWGDAVRVVCTANDGTTGVVTAAELGFSAVHRHGLPAPDGSIRDAIMVEPTTAGALTVTYVLPSGFASRVVAAPGAVEVTDRTVVWRRDVLAGPVVQFDVVLDGPADAVSEVGELTIEHVRDGALVASAFDVVESPTGRATSRLRMLADRDVEGTAPTFTARTDRLDTLWPGRFLAATGSAHAISNGLYSGPVHGHVEALYDDLFPPDSSLRGHGMAASVGLITWYDFARIKKRSAGARAYWGTSDYLPFDHHEVVSQTSMTLAWGRSPGEMFLDEGPQTVDGGGGQLALSQVGPTAWGTGLTSQSYLAQQNDPFEVPSRAGEPTGAVGVVLDVSAVGGDADNRDGTLGPGDAFVFRAPPGWYLDFISYSGTARVALDAEFDLLDNGVVTIRPTLTDGAVFPVTWDGAPYRNTIAITAFMYPDEPKFMGTPVPGPVPVQSIRSLTGTEMVTVHR